MRNPWSFFFNLDIELRTVSDGEVDKRFILLQGRCKPIASGDYMAEFDESECIA